MKSGFKKILLFLIIPVILGGILHYTISFKIKNILELIVENRSNHSYSFHAKKIEVSFWNKNLIVEDAQLISLDSAKAKTHYGVEIPHMTMEIESWMDIFFRKKLSIHHLSFIDSKIHIHEKSINKTNVDLKDVFKSFEEILDFLEVKALAVTNGSFYYKTIRSEKELRAEGINFSVQNLSEKNEKGHLLYSEDIRIDIKNQEWNLPDGIHTISFKNLSFSGKNKLFELDSFIIKSAATANKGAIHLYADKFFFNSLELESMYQKNILDIDTVLCVRPVLTIVLDKNKPIPSNTPKSISTFLPQLFKESYINYINIEDGQILLKQDIDEQTNTLVQKSNLKIYNLSVNEMRAPIVKTDSILFGLKDIQFVTPDSAYHIFASDLMIINDDLILKNSFFGPTHVNTNKKNISFFAPEFRLNNINFVDLIQKRLNASQAELYNPTIRVASHKSDKNKTVKTDTSLTTLKHFYAALHEFRELVGIEKLRIINGNVLIKNSDKHHTQIQMKGINALILPIHFVNSDSLIHIKQALPEVMVADLSFISDNINLSVSNFRFDGMLKKSYADNMHLKIKNEIDIQGKDIYWEIFNWNLFQTYKRIQIEEFSAQKLSIKTIHTQIKKSGKNKSTRKNLPDIRLSKFKVNQLSLSAISGNDTSSFEGQNIIIDSLRSLNRFLVWANANGTFKNIQFKKEEQTVQIQFIQLNTDGETSIQNIRLSDKKENTDIQLTVPSIKIRGIIYSTDLSELNINKILIESPDIKYFHVNHLPNKNTQKNTFHFPMEIQAKELVVSNAWVNYLDINVNDTLAASGKFNIRIINLATSKTKNELFQFDRFALDINKLQLKTKDISLEIPSASLLSKNGTLKSIESNTITFQSDLSAQWANVYTMFRVGKNNGVLRLENISGTFSQDAFVYSSDKAIALQSILNNTNQIQGSLRFVNNTSIFRINDFTWKNKSNVLSCNNIIYQPKLSLEEATQKATSQFDYLTLNGKSIQLENIQLTGTTKKSIIHIQNIMLDQFELTSIRDKNVPKGIMKLKEMPTKLIQSITWPITIDSINVTNSKVIVHQIEEKSFAKSMIPIKNIHATITNVTNQASPKDSLYLTARGTILDVVVKSFKYTESYADSLSYFHASTNIIPGDFKSLNTLTVPLANVAIDNGHSNKLNAVWAGNKYATIGQMNFMYENLEVHLLHKTDTSQNNIALKIENELAQKVIKKNNTERSVIFFERNTEKQIFHYWLKAILQGVYSSTGVKNSEKYLKRYKKVEQKYDLPKNTETNKGVL